jgi:hypothetical protein
LPSLLPPSTQVENRFRHQEALAKYGLCRLAAPLGPWGRPQSRPEDKHNGGPSVLATEQAAHPDDEQHSAKAS